MTATEILKELKPLAQDGYKRILLNHGIQEPVWGVKIEELKKVQKRVKKNHELACELFETGIYDIQYLAGLIADEQRMTKKDLKRWLAKSNSDAICGFIVAGVAADGPHGWDLALEWIDSKQERVAQTGWKTLASWVAVTEDSELDLKALKQLLKRVEKTIHTTPNHVRYAMNGFVISLGGYVKELTDEAIKTAERIGTVSVDMGNTACEVPYAPDYIRKIQKRGTIGKKRKTARC